MFANNWAEMPQYFVTSATESLERRGFLHYVEVNQEIFKSGGQFREI
jgi:GTP-binding protein